MLGGPILRAELLRTARRKRYYVLRVIYGALLLLFVAAPYNAFVVINGGPDAEVSIAKLAWIGAVFFYSFLITQFSCVMVLVPAFVAGVIADEKQRRTIHYLMASQLSSGEIICDKLGARLLHLVSFLALGIPIICLISLFGGLSPLDVGVGFGVTFSFMFFASALAILVSTFARNVRQAVLVAYLVELAWLILPPLALGSVYLIFRKRLLWGMSPDELLMMASPVGLFAMTRQTPFGMAWLPQYDLLAWTAGIHLGLGALLLLLAILQLRPTFRRQEEKPRRLTWFKAKARPGKPVRVRPRSACNEDPMFWKEWHFARTDIFTKLFVLPATVLLTVVLILGSGIDEWGWHVIQDLWNYGFARAGSAQSQLTEALRRISPYYIGLWLLAVAGASASSVTVEREQSTWEGLVSTPMSGFDILRGKMLGAVFGLRGFGGLLGLLWVFGLVTGAIHPLGLLAALAALALLTWFVTALGFYAGLKARSTSQALTRMIVLLVVLNGGYLFPRWLLYRQFGSDWGGLYGCMPYIAANALGSYAEVRDVWQWLFGGALAAEWFGPAAIGLCFLGAYGLGAAFLTRFCLSRFDQLVDRPRRSRQMDEPAVPPVKLGVIRKEDWKPQAIVKDVNG
jgi:ABC-type transport system involved in multi-copper enzyme maturation permease subunit